MNMHVKTKSLMEVMDPTGHTTVEWDADVSAEVDIARAAFDGAIANGWGRATFDPQRDALNQQMAAAEAQMAIARHQYEFELYRSRSCGASGGLAAPAVHRTSDNPAARRAQELLMSYLSDEQKRSMEAGGYFIVVGGRSGRRYRIECGRYAGNVKLLRLHAANDNDIEAAYCGHCEPTSART